MILIGYQKTVAAIAIGLQSEKIKGILILNVGFPRKAKKLTLDGGFQTRRSRLKLIDQIDSDGYHVLPLIPPKIAL